MSAPLVVGVVRTAPAVGEVSTIVEDPVVEAYVDEPVDAPVDDV